MLGSAKVMAFASTAKPEESRRFYEGTLGLRFAEDSPFALVFDAGGTMLRIQKVAAVTPIQGTTLGWEVPDIRQAVTSLAAAGVVFNTKGCHWMTRVSGQRRTARRSPGSTTRTATRCR